MFQVGAMALKQTQDMLGRSLENIVKNKKGNKYLFSLKNITFFEIMVCQKYFYVFFFFFFKEMMGGLGKDNIGPQCPHELVDFSPLHRCLHIHSVLGAKNDFIQYYR